MNTSSTVPSQTHLLLVEDDPDQLRLYAAVLRNAFGDAVRLTCFDDSERAAAFIDAHLVDVLATDLLMPVVDGLALMRRAKGRFPGVQTVMMTAGSTPDSLVEAADLGAADYLLKPFAPTELIEVVSQAKQRVARWRTALSGTLHRERESSASPV